MVASYQKIPLLCFAAWVLAGTWACDGGGGAKEPTGGGAEGSAKATGTQEVKGSENSTESGKGSASAAGPVILSELWKEVPPELQMQLDPNPDHRPSEVECKPGTFRVEDGSFEVETGACNYALFYQPLMRDLQPGQQLHMVAWHLNLLALENGPVSGHMHVRIGDETLFEVAPGIPAKPKVYDLMLTVQQAHPAGEHVVLHLHNHGFNDWNLLKIETKD